ncbi:MAG TPA: ferritin-like domain-containing protein [Herpetosiphonaceae bacterium]
MKLNSLNDLLIHELQDLLSAETQITKALPKMAKAASTPELRAAFEEHLAQTENQIKRLEKAFSLLSSPAKSKTCKGMQGLLEEGEELLKTDAASAVLDAALISAAQRVEHYEIAAYGTARHYARQLGFTEVARLLEETLDEEGQTDQKLSRLAEQSINPDAASAEVGGASR